MMRSACGRRSKCRCHHPHTRPSNQSHSQSHNSHTGTAKTTATHAQAQAQAQAQPATATQPHTNLCCARGRSMAYWCTTAAATTQTRRARSRCQYLDLLSASPSRRRCVRVNDPPVALPSRPHRASPRGAGRVLRVPMPCSSWQLRRGTRSRAYNVVHRLGVSVSARAARQVHARAVTLWTGSHPTIRSATPARQGPSA